MQSHTQTLPQSESLFGSFFWPLFVHLVDMQLSGLYWSVEGQM